MQRIKPQEVVAAVQELATTGVRDRALQIRGRSSFLPILADAPDGKPLGVVDRPSSLQDEEEGDGYFIDPAAVDLSNRSQRAGKGVNKIPVVDLTWIARTVIFGVAT